jgi:hypothetical protein
MWEVGAVEIVCRLSPYVDSEILGRTGIAERIEGIGSEMNLVQSVGRRQNLALSLDCHIVLSGVNWKIAE